MATHKDFAQKITELEKRYAGHDENFRVVFEAIRQILELPKPDKKRRIGFVVHDEDV